MSWQLIETAPRDGSSILAWCDHSADPYSVDSKTLTLYGAHCEGMSHVDDGINIVCWGGGFDDSSWEDPNGARLDDWWFRHDSEFEVAANPTHWMPLPIPPGFEALTYAQERMADILAARINK